MPPASGTDGVGFAGAVRHQHGPVRPHSHAAPAGEVRPLQREAARRPRAHLGGTQSDKQNWLGRTEIFDPTDAFDQRGPGSRPGTRRGEDGRAAQRANRCLRRQLRCPGDRDVLSGDRDIRIGRLPDGRPAMSRFTATSLDSGGVLLAGGLVNANAGRCGDAEIFEEIVTEAGRRPAMTFDSIRALLADSDPAVVSETTEWLEGLGPQVKPILENLAGDGGIRREPTGRQRPGDDRGPGVPEAWCVEVWGPTAGWTPSGWTASNVRHRGTPPIPISMSGRSCV